MAAHPATAAEALATLFPAHAPARHRCGGPSARPSARPTPRQACPPSAALSSGGSLASYPFPVLEPTVPLWLADSVRDLAKHVEQAPLLQLVLPGQQAAQRHTVPPAVVQTPQLWRSIAEHLSRSDPDSVVLVHPLADAGQERVSSTSIKAAKRRLERLDSRQEALTGIAVRARGRARQGWRLQACERLLEAGLATAELAGRVGDCCEDEDGPAPSQAGHSAATAGEAARSNVVSFPRGAARPPPAAAPQHGLADGAVSYYGVVVQSKLRNEAEGCYVLKTVRVGGDDEECSCLHYTLVRVTRGEPVASQLLASWLC